MSVDRVRDRLVRASCLVLVDHGRAFAVVTHPRHQIPQARAAGRGECVARVPQIVEMKALGGGACGAAGPASAAGSLGAGGFTSVKFIRGKIITRSLWRRFLTPGRPCLT